MKASFDWKDVVAVFVIFVVSYWLAFKSGASKIIVNYFDKPKKGKKARGDITGDAKAAKESYIKKFEVLVFYRSESGESTRLAEKFAKESNLKCELCDETNSDFTVLEFLEIPVVFILDRSEGLQEFLTGKAKDSKDVRAYTRRFLSNLRFAVFEVVGDRAFAQFVDEALCALGARRVQELGTISSSDKMTEFTSKFDKNIK